MSKSTQKRRSLTRLSLDTGMSATPYGRLRRAMRIEKRRRKIPKHLRPTVKTDDAPAD